MKRAALAALIAGIGAAPPAPAEPPVEEDYVLHCSACHGADGSGTPGVVPGLGDVGAIARLPGGRDYLMRVPGAAQAPLDDARLARLLDWVVVRFGGAGEGAGERASEEAGERASNRASEETSEVPRFAPEEVGAARLRPWRDPGAARARVTSGSTEPTSRAATPR